MIVAEAATDGAGALRGFFRSYASGVTIVTLASPTGPVGFTASSLASVSLDPPLVSFNVSRTSSSWAALEEAEHVGVHLLGQDDRAVARLFATSGADRFATTPWRTAYAGVPVLPATAGWLVCRVVDRLEAGDSTLVLARVEAAAQPRPRDEPLVWADGDFRRAVKVGV